MRICASVNLKGKSLEAMRFYGHIFNAAPEYVTWADMPPCPEFTVTEELKPMVMHGEIQLGRDQSLMFADDIRPGEGVLGNAFSLTLLFDAEAELRRIYTALLDGGEAIMPPDVTFWSACFAMLKDRFGIVWSLNLCRLPVGEEFMAAKVEYPQKHLIGLKIRSSMQHASQDCPALWRKFGPRMGELPQGEGSYGVSVMFGPEEFEYLAAVEAGPALPVPAGMERFTLPAGPYAKCQVPSLGKVHAAYSYLYDELPKKQSGFVPNLQAPCFEWYPANWSENVGFELYVPLKKA